MEVQIIELLGEVSGKGKGKTKTLSAKFKYPNGSVDVVYYENAAPLHPNKGEWWNIVRSSTDKKLWLSSKKEKPFKKYLLLQREEECYSFRELKTRCIFYMQLKDTHGLFFKLDDVKAYYLSSGLNSGAVTVHPDTACYPYYEMSYNVYNRNALHKMFNDNLITE